MNARKYLCVIFLISLFSDSVFSAWTEPVLVTEVNTEFDEWSPFLSFDGLTLYFARVRTSESYYGRIFEATRNEPAGEFTNVIQVPGELNSLNGHVVCPWVSSDNLRMYYHTEQSGIGWNLMLSERASINDPWPAGKEITELNSLGNYIQVPRLTPDELIIFFEILDMPGGQHDIWMASRSDRNMPFESARSLSEINTSSNEGTPSISSNGLTLYFTSDRNGTEQLFKATRTSLDMPFGNVEHLSFFDTPNGNSAHPSIASDGSAFYFVRHKNDMQDIYVSYYYPDNSYFVDATNGDDFNSGSSPQTPLATIQKAIDTAPEGYTIFVKPGTYGSGIDFNGKAVTVQGLAGPEGVPILEMPDNFAVLFINNEGPDSVLKNVVIRNSFMAVLLVGSSPTISNVTIVDNTYGIRALAGANPDISNCIFWNNIEGDLSGCASRYCLTSEAGEGNIYGDPLFVGPENGDYHLKSERGRYWSEHNVWILDKVTSPGIDSGDPNADISEEPMPNGGFINIGAFGGTSYASMSDMPFPEPDYNKDGIIDEADLADLVDQWLAVSGWVEQ